MPASATPLLQVRDLVQEFVVRDYGGVKGGVVNAVSGVSFNVWPGETLGIVGETGSGKSTLARSVLQAPRPKSGAVMFRGTDLVTLRGSRLLQARRHLQMVFQDPFGSLDPKWKVRDLVAEPLIAYRVGDRAARRHRVEAVLELVGLDPAAHGGRRPRELSGGQAQRVAIARALAVEPAMIIRDEPVSSLDVLIQAQVLNLFEQLRAELGLSYLFIAHDLALVKQVSDRVAVMYLGKLAEVGPGEAVYWQPMHPYTRALLDSVPGAATARAAGYRPTDSCTTLAGLAIQTERVRLGTLMTASTYRRPGPLAITVATVDGMSGGRAELGIGAAWIEQEHRYLGIPFPPLGERFDRLGEQLEIITGLWATPPGERFSFCGKNYQLEECASVPRPARRPPIIIGGAGPRRTPALAARFADEFNSGMPDGLAARFANFRRICEQSGRDPAEVRLSTTLPVCCGSTRGEAARRAAGLGEAGARMLTMGVTGTPGDIVGRLAELKAAGADTVYFHLYDVTDLDHVRLLGAEVLPQVTQI